MADYEWVLVLERSLRMTSFTARKQTGEDALGDPALHTYVSTDNQKAHRLLSGAVKGTCALRPPAVSSRGPGPAARTCHRDRDAGGPAAPLNPTIWASA